MIHTLNSPQNIRKINNIFTKYTKSNENNSTLNFKVLYYGFRTINACILMRTQAKYFNSHFVDRRTIDALRPFACSEPSTQSSVEHRLRSYMVDCGGEQNKCPVSFHQNMIHKEKEKGMFIHLKCEYFWKILILIPVNGGLTNGI